MDVKRLYSIIESEIEKGSIVGKFLREAFPVFYLALKNPLRFPRNFKNYIFYKKVFDFNSELIKFSVIGTAMELGIFSSASEWKTASQIADELKVEKTRLETILDSLVYFGVMERRNENGNYQYRVKDDMGDIKFLWAQMKALTYLPEILKQGRPSENLDIYNVEGDYVALLYGVNSFLYTATQELMRKFKFENIKRIMIGSMGISFAKNIVKAFPDVEIHIGCYPHLIRHVPDLIRKYKIPEKNIKSMKNHKGVPTEDRWGDEEKGYDLVFLTKKLSLKPTEEFGDLFLKKTFSVLRPSGYAVIWESIVGDDGASGPVEESVLDLLTSYSGRRWKESEIKEYILSFGFSDVKIVRCLAGRTSFAIAEK